MGLDDFDDSAVSWSARSGTKTLRLVDEILLGWSAISRRLREDRRLAVVRKMLLTVVLMDAEALYGSAEPSSAEKANH
jgi:hypothetical protein